MAFTALLLLSFSSYTSVTVAVLFGEPRIYGEDATGYGPIFEEEPVDVVYSDDSPDKRISMNCRARANPPAFYSWRHDNWEVKLKEQPNEHYSLVGGNLVITNPTKKHAGTYICVARNIYGIVLSKDARVKFGFIEAFPDDEREPVYVKEGQGAVLLCVPPKVWPEEVTYQWIYNEFPVFLRTDRRRFVSQNTGNLYIAKVEAQDAGNYSCFVSSPILGKSVYSKFIPLIPLPPDDGEEKKYPADIRVKFPDTTAMLASNITLECFALGNPIPHIVWRKVDATDLPANHEISESGAVLHLYNVQYEDVGGYDCEAINTKGKDWHKGWLYVESAPEWAETINNTQVDIGSEHTMRCVASGKPFPFISWYKNGFKYGKNELKFSSLTFDDSGMYQCIAENRHGVIYANAELRVVACAPTFEHLPVNNVLAPKNGRVVIECRPKAAPKPTFFWSKDTELLSNSSRVFIWEDGSLEILDVTQADAGRYTCFAENDLGKANSTRPLLVTESTKITLAPSNVDVNAGENTWMQCAASHDARVDITFIWSQDGKEIDLIKNSAHYESVLNGSSNSKLLIKNVQLKHAGLYTCTANTQVDNITASAHLVVRGPPGAPGGVRIVNRTDKSMTLEWFRGADHHSPISKYIIQYRDQFSKDVWKNATTIPSDVEGNTETATVINLIPWTEYEFRVVAINTLGTGDPSRPSPKETTLDSDPVVAPSDVGGGGGASRELTITWTPVHPQYYYGPNFGYIVAFKPHDESEWKRVAVADPQAKRYVHKDASISPLTKFDVKVKAFNNQGEGPYSLTAVVYSAQDAPSEAPENVEGRVLSATTSTVSWIPIPQNNIDGYQIKYWRNHEDGEGGAQRVVLPGTENHTKLEGLKPNSEYLIEVRGYNSAGYGPPSSHFRIHTKKPPPDRPPKILSAKIKGQSVNIAWEHVEPLANESTIDGYLVLYKKKGTSVGTLYTTSKRHIDLPWQADGKYVVEVRAHTEGGDGPVAQTSIKGAGILPTASPSLLLLLPMVLLLLNV
uniref:Contactin 1 n=3 Tax=Nothobranchius pienaari TaxID=704102 RepID=A0A1A8NW40_9TELE